MNASIQQIQNSINYILDITKANEIKITAGMHKDYTITLKEYDLSKQYDLMKIMKEFVFE